VTPILAQERKRLTPESIEEWAEGMQKLGVPINRAESVALAVVNLMKDGSKSNGAGLSLLHPNRWLKTTNVVDRYLDTRE
jgi:hypothetical protein